MVGCATRTVRGSKSDTNILQLRMKCRRKAEVLAATTSALDKKELPALAPGAMCYMMAKQQYLKR